MGVYCIIMKNHELGKLIIYGVKNIKKGDGGQLMFNFLFYKILLYNNIFI